MKALRVLGYSFIFALIWSCLMFEAVLVEAKTPKIEVGEYVIEPGAKVKISIKNKPKKLISIKYSTSDKTIATVSQKGYITGHNIGDTEIKVSLKYLNSKGKKINKSLKCNVIVMPFDEDDYEEDYDEQIDNPIQNDSVPYVPEGTSYYKNDDYSVNYYRYSNEPFVDLIYECLPWPIGNVIRIIGYDGYPEDLIIPGKLEYHFSDKVELLQVVDIQGFEGCETLKSVELPGDTTISCVSVDEYAFAYCENLRRVRLSNTTNTIFPSSFLNCYNLEEVDFGEGVHDYLYIDRYSFSGCSSLSELKLPSSKSDILINSNAFKDCTQLKSVTLIDDSPEYVRILDNSFAGCKSILNVTLPEYTTMIASTAFADCEQAVIKVGAFEVLPGEPYDLVAHRVHEICSQIINPTMNQIERIKAAHDWIAENVDYSLIHRNAYEALMYGECVCTGFSELFAFFMKEIGVPCVYYTGFVGYLVDTLHAWNLVKLENEMYYLVDMTFDATSSAEMEGICYKYFLLSPNSARDQKRVVKDAWILGDHPDVCVETKVDSSEYADQDYNWESYLTA